jgi:Cu/Ag efflux protein CusF
MTHGLRIIIGGALAIALTACAGLQKPSGQIEDKLDVSATVTAVDLAQRLITVKAEDADPIEFEAADAIKNLEQVKVGDKVVLTVTEALAWQVRPAGEGGPGASTGDEVTTAPAGAKPSLTAKRTFKLTAGITAIDQAKGTVTLTGPQGNSRTFKATDPANLKKVKVGDLVDIVYSQAVALAVRPAAKP